MNCKGAEEAKFDGESKEASIFEVAEASARDAAVIGIVDVDQEED